MSIKYVVVNCPYGSMNGTYNPDVPVNQFIHTDGAHYLYFDQNEQKWSLSDDRQILCRGSRTAEPLQKGWEYWKVAANAYVLSSSMAVFKQPFTKAKPEPKPEPQPAPKPQPAPEPAPGPSVNPEVDKPTRPGIDKTPSIAWPKPAAAPTLKPYTFDTDGWEQRTTNDWMGSSTFYINTRTGAKQTAMPEAYRYAQSRLPNVAATELQSANPKHPSVEIFAPVKFAKAQGKPIKDASFYDQWAEIEPLWCHTIYTMEEELITIKSKLSEGKDKERNVQVQRKELNDQISRLDATLQEVKGRERQAQQKSDTMISRVGKSHIKRDWQQTKLDSEFPTGEDFRNQYLKDFLNFDSFAEDAVTCLEMLGHEEDAAKDVLVRDVLVPIYIATLNDVTTRLLNKKGSLKNAFGGTDPDDEKDDSIAKLFWYSTMQTQMPKTIADLKDSEIADLMKQMNPTVHELHLEMIKQGEANVIANDEHSTRIGGLVRIMLRIQTISALSDPRCFFLPAPGVRLAYQEGFCMEVLSPGTKRFGRIKEGDTVEVVLPGLYFDNPTDNFSAVKPIVPCLVRRLVSTAK